MSTVELEVDEDVTQDDPAEGAEPSKETAKSNLKKRREVDDLLEERRLKKLLADYDFDL